MFEVDCELMKIERNRGYEFWKGKSRGKLREDKHRTTLHTKAILLQLKYFKQESLDN